VFYGADGPEVLFLLMSGKVEMYRLSPDGKKLTLVLVEPGAIFGRCR
jgi:CRP-like cAMP-binding protein